MQTNNKINYADQLRQVRDSLTNENWLKGSYFSIRNNQTCFCVHGAAQFIVNPEVKKGKRVDVAGAPEADTASYFLEKKDLFGGWLSRPDHVRRERVCVGVNNGSLNLHWLMGMFGITASFNDSPSTTLEMLKDKLTEAAKWAEENEEFLNNN
jgi:hypothetical protein